MNVGDLVQISVEAIMSGEPQSSIEETGMIVEIVSHEEVLVLWDDGVIEYGCSNDMVVVSESI